MDDGRLIDRMRKGDDQAFSFFIQRHYDDVVAYCQRHSRHEDGQAIAHDVFLLFFKHLGAYDHRGQAKNYLYTIARNQCLNRQRRAYRHQTAVAKLADQTPEALADPNGQTVDRLTLQTYVDQLDQSYQEVLKLRFWEDMKVEDVAQELNISTPLVNYRLRAAKARLKSLVSRATKDEADES